jgi:hypothetical protein
MEMSDESNNKQQELQRVQNELKNGGVSRRRFLDSMKGLGVGFGAAFLLGIKESHASRLDPSVSVKSTNPAIDDIVKDGQAAQEAASAPENAEKNLQLAQYFRVYRRGYRRFYRRYHRYYSRYARFYRRYSRVYLRY